MTATTDRAQLRKFGLLVGGVFGAIGVWPVIFGAGYVRTWAVGLALALILPALVAPRTLRGVYTAWMAVANALGWFNTRVMLVLIFFGLFTPTSVILRLARHDPMRRALDPDATTYRTPRQPRPGAHMLRGF